jgi:hypothetical protein
LYPPQLTASPETSSHNGTLLQSANQHEARVIKMNASVEREKLTRLQRWRADSYFADAAYTTGIMPPLAGSRATSPLTAAAVSGAAAGSASRHI